jgi:adenylate cyclase
MATISFGDGVNVAARLESISQTGGICISDVVHQQVNGRVKAAFADLGEQNLKNIARPVRAYCIALDQERPRPAPMTSIAPPALVLPDKPSIAVLPFQNISGDPEQEYFADGVVEEIITALSRMRWLFVIARNSSFTYKGRAVDVRQVGRELGVRYVLEGSVRREGVQLRITAQLVDAATGNHIWADKYDGALDDVFGLQDRIASDVVGAIEPNVRHAEIERARRKRPESLDAYDLYLRALPRAGAYSVAESTAALDQIEAALRIDPNYGAAHALAAWRHHTLFTRGGLDPVRREAALRHARAALASGTDDAMALATAGFVVAMEAREIDTALGAIDRALAYNPNSALALGRAGEHVRRPVRQGDRTCQPFDPVEPAGPAAIRAPNCVRVHLFPDRTLPASRGGRTTGAPV